MTWNHIKLSYVNLLIYDPYISFSHLKQIIWFTFDTSLCIIYGLVICIWEKNVHILLNWIYNVPFTYLFIRPSPWHTTISSFPRQPNVSGDSDCRKGLGQANETLLVTSRSYEKVPEGRQPNMGQLSTGRELPPWKNDVISSVKVTVTIIKILSYRQ